LSSILKSGSLRWAGAKKLLRHPFKIWRPLASFRDAQPHNPLLHLAAFTVYDHEPNRDQAGLSIVVLAVAKKRPILWFHCGIGIKPLFDHRMFETEEVQFFLPKRLVTIRRKSDNFRIWPMECKDILATGAKLTAIETSRSLGKGQQPLPYPGPCRRIVL